MLKPNVERQREILRIALPSVLTNVTVPLLGLVDLAIVGHLSSGDEVAILLGAIAVGTLIFNLVYWVFNFLRIGTSGLTAQAFGRADQLAQRQVLLRGLAVGAVCGTMLLVLQWPIGQAARWLIGSSAEVWTLASLYFKVRIWAAPAVLMLFAVNGWLIGMQNSVYPMVLAVLQNIINIVLSLCLVRLFGMGIEGVAWGTVLSQYFGLALTALLIRKKYRFVTEGWQGAVPAHDAATRISPAPDAQPISYRAYFTVQIDIFLRMLCLIAVTCSVTAIGARHGNLLLAVNTLLMQLFTIFSYFTDGFATAGEALTGKYVGQRRAAPDADTRLRADLRLRALVRALLAWGCALAGVFTLLYAWAGLPLLSLLADDADVLQAAGDYLPWAVAIPIASFAAFVWDGIYIGATATRLMLASLAVSAALFFALYFGLPQPTANHRLWLAFVAYLLTRSLFQTIYARRALAMRPPGHSQGGRMGQPFR